MEAIYEEMEVESCYNLLELPSVKKKRRNRDVAGNSDKPKKPRSAYLLYYFDVRQNMQQKNPELPQSEINKCISDSWKRLNVADRGYYLERARMERDGVDPSSQSAASSPDVPGFRRILPRANYVLLPKNSVGGESGPVGLCVDGMLDGASLGGEVELSEQSIAIETLDENHFVSSSQLTQKSCANEGTSGLGRDVLKPSSAIVNMKAEESGALSDIGIVIENGTDVGLQMPEIKTDASRLVAIIPHQGLVENKMVSAAGPVMMFPLVKSLKAEPKPSFKLPIRYTRRGRGNCPTPGCVFSYVTRHKPPQCPDCGQHLGGKWVTPLKRTTSMNATSPGEWCDVSKLPTAHSALLTDLKDAEVRHNADGTERTVLLSQKYSADGTQDRRSASYSSGGCRRRERSSVTSHDAAILSLNDGHSQVSLKEKCISGVQKRRVRAILPAPAQTNTAVQSALVQWVAVRPDEVKTDAGKAFSEHIVGLKPSTLKQLGHIIPEQFQKPTTVSSDQYIITDNGVKILSTLPIKKTSGCSLDLGLSTARGRGHCKNPACDYVYKNRHKPQHCPTCGWELCNKSARKTKPVASDEIDVCAEVLMDLSQPLSIAQKELQRQSTVNMLRCCLQFPESEAEMQDIFNLIQHFNASGESKEKENRWPTFYVPAATRCSLCHNPLHHSLTAGLEECWLLTECGIQLVTLQVKVCSNLQCLALHSFTDLHPGLFNVGNKLLVTLDLFFKMRHLIRHGDNPADAALSIVRNSRTEGVLSSEHMSRVQELFCSGYWAFECLTFRDYNDMICGLCGIAPKLEVAQRNTNNVLLLKNVEFTWPDVQVTEEVQVDEFWLTMENEALEQAAFPFSIPITRFDASIIAPFIPPLMRSTVVINTEKDKISSDSPAGDPSVLVRLIHDGVLRSDQIEQHSEQELRDLLEKCKSPTAVDSSKEQMLATLSLLYSQVQNGLWTAPETESHMTAGRISQVCPHQVVCGSKYIVRRESARDHVDLLVSTRFWPPVYVTDCAQRVALCADVLYPELTSQMWGRNQGCFSDPTSAPQLVSCSELSEQLYSLDLSTTELNPHLHPLTKSTSRWIVRPDYSSNGSPLPTCDEHYSMTQCKELEPYIDMVGEMCRESESDSIEKHCVSAVVSIRHKALVFENAAYYYLYNRLMDFLSSRDIVNQQITDVLSACQPGEVVMIRDALYRLGVAQLNSEEQGTVDGRMEKNADGVMVEEEIMLI